MTGICEIYNRNFINYNIIKITKQIVMLIKQILYFIVIVIDMNKSERIYKNLRNIRKFFPCIRYKLDLLQ